MSHNQFQFIGNLTTDPTISITPGSKSVATIDIAVDASYKNSDGEKVEKTNFFRIKAWGKLGENAGQFLAKGSSIFVQGVINNNNYTKGDDTVYGFEFVAENIQYLSKKKTD
jgi:single-strand DNA-binding protein